LSQFGLDQFLFLLSVGGAGWSLWCFVRNTRRGPDRSIMPQVDEQFRQLRIDTGLPASSFDGRTADIILQSEQMVDDGDGAFRVVRVFRYARNAHGEYFYVISDGVDKPFFKHIPQANARIVLKKKYIPPPAAR
jgi:hypothetical protein